MNYEEYKKAFEEVLGITEEIENLCKKDQFQNIEPLIVKRNQILSNVSTPEDIDEEKVNYILSLRDKMQAKNNNILKLTNKHKKILKETIEMAANTPKSTENQLKDEYKLPKDGISSSIFDK